MVFNFFEQDFNSTLLLVLNTADSFFKTIWPIKSMNVRMYVTKKLG